MKIIGEAPQQSVQYLASNLTGFLLSILIKGGAGISNDKIEKYPCDGGVPAEICTNGCGGNEFGNYNNFSVVFDSTNSNANIFINDVQQATASLCMNFTEIGGINFTGVVSQSNIKNNTVTANNLKPSFSGNLPNITWDEDTSTSFNISGNFSDSNNDALTYTYTNVENILISINNATGNVTLIPSPDFNGTRYVVFTANDGENITNSNNVTLIVTNVNDVPSVTSTAITNSDFLNRTNGTLIAEWSFSDVDNASMAGNETLWDINGIENEAFRNLTIINSTNTTKNQNWTFSVRVFDGTNFSAFVNSSNITIANALQSFNPALGVESAELNRLFTYDVNYTDLDGDNATFFDNSTLFNITNEGIINFTPGSIGNITVNITLGQDTNVSDILTIEVKDTLAPIITAISASSSGTATVTITLSVTTDETAVCRFTTLNSGLNYSSMTNQMSATNSTLHSNSQDFTSDTSGTYYARCNDIEGNVMNFSNSTNFNADVQEPSSGGGSSSGGGGGGGGTGSRACTLDWQCDSWSGCENGRQKRKCTLVQLEPVLIKKECPQDKTPEQERSCKTESVAKATCSDNIQNQDEEGVDCGGPCKPCPVIEAEEEAKEEAVSTGPTGAVVGAPFGNVKKYGWIILLILMALGLFSYNKLRKKPREIPKNKEVEYEKLFNLIDK